MCFGRLVENGIKKDCAIDSQAFFNLDSTLAWPKKVRIILKKALKYTYKKLCPPKPVYILFFKNILLLNNHDFHQVIYAQDYNIATDNHLDTSG